MDSSGSLGVNIDGYDVPLNRGLIRILSWLARSVVCYLAIGDCHVAQNDVAGVHSLEGRVYRCAGGRHEPTVGMIIIKEGDG